MAENKVALTDQAAQQTADKVRNHNHRARTHLLYSVALITTSAAAYLNYTRFYPALVEFLQEQPQSVDSLKSALPAMTFGGLAVLAISLGLFEIGFATYQRIKASSLTKQLSTEQISKYLGNRRAYSNNNSSKT